MIFFTQTHVASDEFCHRETFGKIGRIVVASSFLLRPSPQSRATNRPKTSAKKERGLTAGDRFASGDFLTRHEYPKRSLLTFARDDNSLPNRWNLRFRPNGRLFFRFPNAQINRLLPLSNRTVKYPRASQWNRLLRNEWNLIAARKKKLPRHDNQTE